MLRRSCEGITNYKNRTKDDLDSLNFCGRILIPQLVYLHELQLQDIPEPTDLQLIQDWTNENIKLSIQEEVHPCGFRLPLWITKLISP